jgi:ribonuclease D
MSLKTTVPHFELIDNQEAFDQLMLTIRGSTWMALDTEFVGERRFWPLLCLLQVYTPHGLFLIDTLRVLDLTSFFDILQDPATLKLTHAGENDYKIFYDKYGVVPVNTWDTQIAAGFVGYPYPSAYHKLVMGDLKEQLNKNVAVTDWEARPISKQQLVYALYDVYYLPQLWERQQRKLIQKNRLSWATQEMLQLELPDSYIKTPETEALNSNVLNGLDLTRQAFVLRLFRWRWQQAEARNVSKEFILPIKFFISIIKGIDGKRGSLHGNRLLPDRIINEQFDTWQMIWETPATDDDITLLKQRPKPISESPDAELTKDLLHLLVKHSCNQAGVAHALVFHKSDLAVHKKHDAATIDWRTELLGEALSSWLERRDPIQIEAQDGQYIIRMDKIRKEIQAL